MKFYYKYKFIIFISALCSIREVVSQRNLNHNIYSDQDRFKTQYYSYSNTEFDHTVDDERCGNRPNGFKTITKNTQYGNVKGYVINLCDKPGVPLRERPGEPNSHGPKISVAVFLGIPYAEPPIRRRNAENLQFKPPRQPLRFGDLDGSKYKPACPQHRKFLREGHGINTTSEDCLYLNIFAPVRPKYETTIQESYPVMIYIHDGNWDHGSGSLFSGHIFAASQQVVVVTFNYRLGPLGFLATADNNSPGNYGMLDQVQAVNWVYENIHDFDGDPKQITVFGLGSGGVSAALLALSPLSNRIIKKAIVMSGSPVAEWAVVSDRRFMYNTTEIAGERLGCAHQDTLRFVDCVGTRLNEIKLLEMKPRIGWLPWVPVVDNFTRNPLNQFLPLLPREMLLKGINSDVSFMTGISRDAGVSIFLEDYVTYSDLDISSEKFERKIREFMKMYNYSVNADGIFNAINFMYKPPIDSSNKTLLRESYVHLLTDRFFLEPVDTFLQLLMKNGIESYAYVLNYTLKGHTSLLHEFVSPETEYLLLSGAPFMDPKFYPSYLKLKLAKWSEDDRNISQFMMEAWANFAREGDPTKTRLFNTILWEPVKENHLRYLNVNATNTTSEMIYDYRQRENSFWSSFLPFFIDREPPTLAPTLEPGIAELRLVTGALWGSVATATLLMLITLVCCILYCKIRRYDSY